MVLWRKTGRKRCDYERSIRVVGKEGGAWESVMKYN